MAPGENPLSVYALYNVMCVLHLYVHASTCMCVSIHAYMYRYKYVFNIETKDRVYFLVSKTRSEMEVWVEAVCKVCGLHTEYSECLTHTHMWEVWPTY